MVVEVEVMVPADQPVLELLLALVVRVVPPVRPVLLVRGVLVGLVGQGFLVVVPVEELLVEVVVVEAVVVVEVVVAHSRLERTLERMRLDKAPRMDLRLA